MLKKVFQRLPRETIAAAQTSAPLQPVRALSPAPAPAIPAPLAPVVKKKVLFLCIGNSCRSPIAEGLARHYGSDVLLAQSAGLAPFTHVDPLGIKVMQARNIDISRVFPKGPGDVDVQSFDLVVNMSGQKFRNAAVPIEDWAVPDPIGQDEAAFQRTADLLEQLVMRLILQLRLK